MIEFERSIDSLESLQSKSNVTLEDILGVFIDLCEDIKGQGCSVDELEIQDSDQLLANLSRSGRIFLKIIKKNTNNINGFDAVERIKRQEEQILNETKEIDEKFKTLSSAKSQLDDKILICEDKKLKYNQRMTEINEKKKYFEKLASECECMESLIDEIDTISIGPLEIEIKDLKDSYQQKQKDVEELETSKRLMQNRYNELINIYENNKLKNTQLAKDVKALEENIASQNQSIDKLEEEKKAKTEEKHELRIKRSQLDQDVVKVQNDIAQLNEQLVNSDYDELCKEKNYLLEEKTKKDKETARVKEEKETILASLQESKDKYTAEREQLEKQKSYLTDTIRDLEHQIEVLKESNSNDEKEKEQLIKTLNDVERKNQQLKQWFESLKINDYDERLKIALQKMTVFEETQKALFDEIGSVGLAQTISMQEANEKKEELRSQFKEIEDSLKQYQEKYRKICELLSD